MIGDVVRHAAVIRFGGILEKEQGMWDRENQGLARIMDTGL